MTDRFRIIALAALGVPLLLVPPAGLASRADAAPQAAAQDDRPPRVLIDMPLRAVEYQLDRLTADELVRVERQPAQARYRPVYVALLSRKGIPAATRQEALATLVALDRSTPTRVLLEALARVPATDDETGRLLGRLLLGQAPALLTADREAVTAAVTTAASSAVLRAGYAAFLRMDGTVEPTWSRAAANDDHLAALLAGLDLLPAGPATPTLVAALAGPIDAVMARIPPAPAATGRGGGGGPAGAAPPTGAVALGAAAATALAIVRPDTATFARLSALVLAKPDPAVTAAAIRGLSSLPATARPEAASLEPLGRALVAYLEATPPARRTQPAAVDAVRLGEALVTVLPEPGRSALRRDLRAVGVQVVRIETIVEQMLYDVRWFVVEAGRPVQITLFNREAMPHNVVVGRPGSLEAIARLGAAVPLPKDPNAKAYVPDSPLVLASTRLLNEGETEALNFTAPREPGEYVFLCSFPGHAARMYGVMLVVADREAWERAPTTPLDPTTKVPFRAPRNQ